MNIDLLHHWLVSMRGGEKVLEQFSTMFPSADIHTLVAVEKNISRELQQHLIRTTSLGKLPGVKRYYKSLLPLYPMAIRNHRVESDFILSSDASLIKGVGQPDDVPHVCYCHSPPRYLWDMQEEYLQRMNPFSAQVLKRLTPYLRKFDLEGAAKVDHFLANSKFVQKRIKRIYNRESTVIYPPVDLSEFSYKHPQEEYYLMVSALVPYKRVGLAVQAFNELEKPLVIIGSGSEKERLEQMAGDNISFLGSQPFEVLKEHYELCRAFIFPGVEDFGITPLEAQASGKAVIAYKEGGALETVQEDETGLFFEEQTPEALIEAVKRFEKIEKQFDRERCRENASRFSPERFRSAIKDFLIGTYPSYFSDFQWGR
ncbi:glycosyltransferase [Aliifodinibius salicampi]|uniref:Glycosyltransferase n=1 Tax=Fodinibius salicampi TaxID=1920655 RepID=A0ABT3PXL9_9BACT|nr:glycosyltransferase [Fodinibius salicampi]MCW9712609.1 glycosyltransferase [Fodinibius salicampi]